MSRNPLHGKVTARWCDGCGTLVLGRKCSTCMEDGREFEVNSPGDIRPCMGTGVDRVLELFEKHFGTSAPLKGRMIFLNKIAGEDRADEIIAHGRVIGAMRFSVVSKEFELELRQGGAELFRDARKNVVRFSGMSGHLKGKTIDGKNVTSYEGDFAEGDPVVLIKGEKIGAGTALCDSSVLREEGKAIRIKDLASSDNITMSPRSDRRTFVRSNEYYLKRIESDAVSDIRSFIKDKKQPLTVSFSGGKDSLAALGVALKVTTPELIFVNTGLEFPETVEYVRRFAKDMGLTLKEADAGDAFWTNVETFGPPAKDFRWCCKTCKLGPMTDLISKEYEKGTITVEGNRALESFARSEIGFVSKNPFVPGQTNLNPIRKWSAAEVWGYIWMKGLAFNPLYERDMERIGCYLCASCLMSEWKDTSTSHPDLYDEWETFLTEYSKKKALPNEYVTLGLWRWKVLPPKMLTLTEGLDLRPEDKEGGLSLKMLKGASPCAAGGFSVEAVLSVPRKRDFSSIEDSMRTIGRTRYSDEFEISMTKCDDGTAKMFGGGQISITAADQRSAERLFERSAKAFLRSQMCTECKICERSCKRKAIRIRNGFKTDAERCISCGKCEEVCMVMHYYDKLMV